MSTPRTAAKISGTPASDNGRTYAGSTHPEDLQRDLDAIRTMYAVYRKHTRPADEVVAGFLTIQYSLLSQLGQSPDAAVIYDDDFSEPLPSIGDEPAPTIDPRPALVTVSEYARSIGLNGWNANLSTRMSKRAAVIMEQQGREIKHNAQFNRLFPPDVLRQVFTAIV